MHTSSLACLYSVAGFPVLTERDSTGCKIDSQHAGYAWLMIMLSRGTTDFGYRLLEVSWLSVLSKGMHESGLFLFELSTDATFIERKSKQ
jgi:hypothetical protein